MGDFQSKVKKVRCIFAVRPEYKRNLLIGELKFALQEEFYRIKVTLCVSITKLPPYSSFFLF